jgi:S1-C subfamily serine protease
MMPPKSLFPRAIRFLLACSAIGLSACHSTSARKFLDRAVAGMPQVRASEEISRLAARKTFQAWSFNSPLTPKAVGSLGMGVLISMDGYALTAAHVVSRGDGGFLRAVENDVSGKSQARSRTGS